MSLHNEIFKRQLWGFFCNDMDSCIEVSLDIQKKSGASRFKGGLNFTSALLIFSVIDMLSGYYSGKRANSDMVAKFLVAYLGKYDDRFSDFAFAKKFYEVFRHGLSHQWAPKYSGVDMGGSKDFLYIKDGTVTVLAIPAFYEVIKKVLKDYENDLDVNKELKQVFETRHQASIEADKEEMENLRGMMEV